MNQVFCAMLLIGVIAAAANGRLHEAQAALFSGGSEAISFCLNMAAELLGMGGAATPAGLSAMRKMAAAGGQTGRLSDAMALFLVLNMCSVQLLPTTMIAIRAQAGAKSPADITLPTLISTAVAGLTGIVLCKFFASRSKNHA